MFCLISHSPEKHCGYDSHVVKHYVNGTVEPVVFKSVKEAIGYLWQARFSESCFTVTSSGLVHLSYNDFFIGRSSLELPLFSLADALTLACAGPELLRAFPADEYDSPNQKVNHEL